MDVYFSRETGNLTVDISRVLYYEPLIQEPEVQQQAPEPGDMEVEITSRQQLPSPIIRPESIEELKEAPSPEKPPQVIVVQDTPVPERIIESPAQVESPVPNPAVVVLKPFVPEAVKVEDVKVEAPKNIVK